MKKQVICIGNKIYYRINRTKAKKALRWCDILVNDTPKETVLRPYSDYRIIRKKSTFPDNPKNYYYMQCKTLIQGNGKIIAVDINPNIIEIW